MKKLLLISNNSGGILSFRKELIETLVKKKYNVIVSVPDDSRNNEIVELGCKVVPVKNLDRRGTNPISDLALYYEYRNLIKKINPNIILSYTIKPNIYGCLAAQVYKTPYIANITGLGTAVDSPGILQKITVLMYKCAMRKAHTIFFQNTANRDFFITHGIDVKNSLLIPGSGVNLSYHKIQPYPKDNSIVRFLFISRLMKQKGIEEYFACAEEFKDRAEFHIVGSCEEDYANQLNELQKQGLVIYHGKQNDVRPFIGQAHCLIHPTYYPEGMSNVILESASAGRPVITTGRSGCIEAVANNITGFVFEERNRSQLFECVEKFLSMSCTERENMGLLGRLKMEQEFDRKIVVDTYLKEIENTIE